MLKCEIVDSPDQKMQILFDNPVENTIWVVSDVQTKFWMQAEIRKLKGSLFGEKVLRASELWSRLLLRMDPQWKLLSPQVALFFIEKWMGRFKSSSGQNFLPLDRQRAYDTVEQLLPILTHEQGDEALREWFTEKEEAKGRWESWYELSQSIWSDFLTKKQIPSEWVSGVLVNEEIPWDDDQNLIFDLGIQLGPVESELILNLSRLCDVTVIVPKNYTNENLSNYQPLVDRGQNKQWPDAQVERGRHYKKLPSMLSEVKEACAQVREWLDEGIPAEDIAIVSPVIENYWPTLSEYLLVEGVPVKKAVVSTLSQYPNFQSWTSALRLSLESATSIHGKQYFFLNNSSPKVTYQYYNTYYKNIFEPEDFKRKEEVAKSLPATKDPEEEFTFSQFMKWAMTLWPTQNFDPLDQILQNFDVLGLIDEKLPAAKWVEFIEVFLARKEKSIKEPDKEGIHALSFQSADNIPFRKVIYVGLTESNLKNTQSTSLTLADVESLKIQLGFYLSHAERNLKHMQLQWLEDKTYDEGIYLCSETDFAGLYQTPSLFWMKEALSHGQGHDLTSPGVSRWDEVMNFNRDNAAGELGLSPDDITLVEKKIQDDLGGNSPISVVMPKLSLSASSIEEYFKCPFRYFAKKGLKLDDKPSLDLDVDNFTRGNLMHKLCEFIVKENNYTLDQKELETLVDRARDEVEYKPLDERLWESVKLYYVSLAKIFVEFELEWRKEYPNTNTVATELEIDGFIDGSGESLFTPSASQGAIPFKGKVDRVDVGGGQGHFIIDYKSSKNDLSQYGSWLRKGKLQMLLYASAIEQGLSDMDAQEVVGACYYVVKDKFRNYGFHFSEDSEFLPKSKLSKEDKDKLIEESTSLTRQMVRNIVEGQFPPKPADPKTCIDCDWKNICRKPQLSQ